MVDLDQCTHATINGCDKEQQGWYPLPSSLSPSICLLSCPSHCPLPNCFSLTISHLHLCWQPPGRRPSVRTGVLLRAGVPDALSTASIHLPRPAPWENSELSFYPTYHDSLFHRFLAHALQLQSFSPGLALAVFHVIHVCTYSLQPYREIFLPLTICAPPESTFKIQMSHPRMQHLHSHLSILPRHFCTEYVHLCS